MISDQDLNSFIFIELVYFKNKLFNVFFSIYYRCKLTSFSSDYSHCKQENRPSVAMLQLQLLAAFGVGLAMASWVWCEATVHAWERYIRR